MKRERLVYLIWLLLPSLVLFGSQGLGDPPMKQVDATGLSREGSRLPLRRSGLGTRPASWKNATALSRGDFMWAARSSSIPPPSILAAGRGRPWINLTDGFTLPTTYVGTEGVTQVLEHNLSAPLALASEDFDEDGVPDLVSGYAGPAGGLVTLHRGNVEAIWPHERWRDGEMGRWGDGETGSLAPSVSPSPPASISPSPFHPGARVFALPDAPEFLSAGDFDGDGHQDVVAAAQDSGVLYLLPGDGQGGLESAQTIDLPGQVTALVTGEINRADGLIDLVVATTGPTGAAVLVFQGPDGALKALPDVLALPTEATALALGQLDSDSNLEMAVAAGSDLLILDRSTEFSLLHSFSSALQSITVGDFIGDEEHRMDLAALTDDGTVHVLSKPAAEQKSHFEISNFKLEISAGSPTSLLPGSPAPLLVRSKVSSLSTDDLIVLDHVNHQLHILTTDDGQRATDDGQNRSAIRHTILDVEGAPVAVLPMRLNVDALSDLVILREGSSAPAVALTAPLVTFVVNSTADTNDGACTTGTGGCTLREAINAANTVLGLDMISFSIPGSGVRIITLSSALPTITDLVTIDGTLQPGFSGSPLIELNGTAVTTSGGLFITAGQTTVRGLIINRFAGLTGGIGIRLLTNGGNRIEGNQIGTNAAGTAALSNQIGISISTPNNTIGGTVPSARNIISGNRSNGIVISGSSATGNRVQGNFIGTDVAGAGAVANALNGVEITDAPGNTIGGTTPEARNIISGNATAGIQIGGAQATGNMVQGNFIGTSRDGVNRLGNTIHGVFIQNLASANSIGGPTSGSGNTIAFNGRAGVFVQSSSQPPPTAPFHPTRNAILSNSIFSNGGLGIDLGTEGVTPNDPGDGDTGANELQNSPMLSSATSGTNPTIQGTLNSRPTASFTLQFFANASAECDPGSGEGRMLLGSLTVQTNASGNASFLASVPTPVSSGQSITATATDSNNNTSEFSPCVLVTTPPADLSVTKTDSPDPVLAGNTITYLVTVTNNGPSNAAGVTLTDPVPANTTFQGRASPPDWTCTQPPVGGTGMITCTNPNFPLGTTAPFQFVVRVNPNTPSGTMIINTATVSSSTTDPTPGNNTATTSTTVSGDGPDLVVTNLTVMPATVAPGEMVTVSFSIANRGTREANNAIHTVRLSPDNVITAMDTFLGTVSTSPLQAGQSMPRNPTVPIPAGTPAGPMFIGVIADADNAIAETIENNNTMSTALIVSPPILQVMPTSLTFNAVVGQSNPPAQTFTLQNRGGGLMSFSISSSDPSLVTVTPTSGALPAGESATVQVMVTTPAMAGTRPATVTVIAPGAQNSPQSVTVMVITIQPLPDLIVTALMVSSTTVQSGGTVTVSFSIRNRGIGPAANTTHNVHLSPDNNITEADPLLTMVTTSTLEAGQNIPFSEMVPIPPSTVGGEMFIGVIADAPKTVPEDNENNNSMNTRITITAPDIEVELLNIDFSSIDVGQPTERSFEVRNVGTALLQVRSFMPTSTGQPFSIVRPSAPPPPIQIPIGGALSFVVRFRPTMRGRVTGTLTITSNDPDEPTVPVELSGVGVEAVIEVSPMTLDFMRVPVRGMKELPLTVRNPGNKELTVEAIATGNPEFTVISPSVPFNVPPGGSQTVMVRFNPTLPRDVMGSLTFPKSNARVAPAPVRLLGTGEGPQITLARDLDFGSVRAGQTKPLPLIVQNQGNVPLIVSDITTTGPFMVHPPLRFSVPAGGQQTVMVSFNPTARGPVMGQLTINSNDLNTPTAMVSLQGSGLAPVIEVSPMSLDFGEVSVGEQRDLMTLRVRNTGDVPLIVSPIMSDKPTTFTVVNPVSPVEVAPQGLQTITVTVRFSPTAAGEHTGTLTIMSDDPDPERRQILIMVRGIARGVLNVSEIFPGGQNVPLKSNVEITFSELLDPRSVTTRTLQVRRGGVLVSGDRVVMSKRVFFFPRTAFDPDTEITIEIGGVRGMNGEILPGPEMKNFHTEKIRDVNQSPTDGGLPVRVETGGRVKDERRPEAAVTIPRNTLKADTLVSIDVVPMSQVQIESGFLPISEVVRFSARPGSAVGVGPGMDLDFPLRTPPPPQELDRPLRLLQMAGNRLVDTGIEAEIVRNEMQIHVARALGVEVFGTYVVAADFRQPGSTEPDQAGNLKLYFPLIGQGPERQTQISFANNDGGRTRRIRVTAYNNDGTLHGQPLTVDLLMRRQTTLRVAQRFPGLQTGAIVAEADGPVTGFYEVADNFDQLTMLDGAEAVLTPLSAMVFPVMSITGSSLTEIHLFNPSDTAARVRLAAFARDGSPVRLSQDMLMLGPLRRAVISSRGGAAPGLPRELDGGYLFAETERGVGIIGAELVEEARGGERNLTILNGLPLPGNCVPAGRGDCQNDVSRPEASAPHSAYAVHLEPGEQLDTELVIINVSHQDALVALAAFDCQGRLIGTEPSEQGFLRLKAHEVMRVSAIIGGADPATGNGYVQILDPASALVGAVINRDRNGRFMTAVPLVPYLARGGLERTNVFFSRLQIDGAVSTGVFILNPNDQPVRFLFTGVDDLGRPHEATTQVADERGTFHRARESVNAIVPANPLQIGFLNLQAQEREPGRRVRLITYATYRSERYFSAIPPQRPGP
jgi:CSLREA domain-containing protein/uncharacterized repeat protein (TIGR01451 family)